ncbi:SDR family NAD(P)-dependent oxidoreductase [Schleiferiaceae bacterium]|jgi:NAD(P)-dependent dehydrogenase (short-subunit alcohol dehydrogenase family)|nr:SDR family NAD(P)-dependent oxidoreductase [Schleiferiaceae bacterium]
MSRILITGAGGGIARAIIPVLHELGHSLLLTTRSRTQELKTYLEEQEIKAAVKSADLTKEEDVAALFHWVQSLGGLDVLVNNAGIAHAAASWKLSAQEMEQLFQVNFFSAVRCSSKALALMRVQERGRIINISSVVAHKPSFGTSGYAATKSALEGYARGIAVDVANKGITANTIAYGYMEAGMLYDVPEPMLEEIKKTIPVGRFGDATQIGHTINYLINSPFTSGQTIHLNGGQWMP